MSTQARDFRGVARPVGTVLMGLALAIALCAGVGFAWDELAPDPRRPQGGVAELLQSAAVVLLIGLLLFRYGSRFVTERLSRREALLTVSAIWASSGLCGTLPFMLGADLPPADALFESVSGLTSTGSTVIADIEVRLSRPMLLWRSLIQWLGGMGIVVLFVAVFPNLGVGAKQLFRSEVAGTRSEGLTPRIAETSFTLWKLYTAFTLLEIIVLFALGIDLFDAVCHAFTTIATAGFSTLDSSIGGFNRPVVEYVIACFMLIGTVDYGLYYAAIKSRSGRGILRSTQFRVFVGIVVTAIVLLTMLNVSLHGSLADSFRYSFFMVATLISSTGYGTHDYSNYGSTAMAIMVILMFIGGCSGSTAGGVKVERVVLMAKYAAAEIRKSFQPSAVQLVRMGRRVIDNQVLLGVAAFLAIYFACMAFGLFFVTWHEQVPLSTAFGAMLTTLCNMGPAPFHSGADNFASYSPLAKVFFSVAMLLGRLEFFTLFALILPGFWRR